MIIQLADPEITRWIIERARDAAVEAGRDPDALAPVVCAPAVVDADLPRWREETRWFPAMVSNHCQGPDRALRHRRRDPRGADRLRAQASRSTTTRDHSRVGAEHGKYISDEIVDRFCLLGEAEQHVDRLRELEELGVAPGRTCT